MVKHVLLYHSLYVNHRRKRYSGT